MCRYIADRPWLFVVAAFVILITVWTGFIMTAVKHGPAPSPLEATKASIRAKH